ncbi:MAG: hypothetical protein A4E48_00356 [Methanosaeta sp. PtaU1.Bin060]|nr:MAG: hypothetical protein A4E48_00356 [Methanosaeta sp. PtaU1.Bin060]
MEFQEKGVKPHLIINESALHAVMILTENFHAALMRDAKYL